MTETPFAISFLKLNNNAKGLGKAYKEDEVSQFWLEKEAS